METFKSQRKRQITAWTEKKVIHIYNDDDDVLACPHGRAKSHSVTLCSDDIGNSG